MNNKPKPVKDPRGDDFFLWYVDEGKGDDNGGGGEDDPLKSLDEFEKRSNNGDYVHYLKLEK